MNQPAKICILSPHFDDAAYSLTLTISHLVKQTVNVTLINCFTVTKWTALPVADKSVESVSKLRALEDAAYNRQFNNTINIINLGLLDAPLRNGYIFQNQPFTTDELELAGKLAKLLLQQIDGILLCPLAIGNHIDHAICREAVMQLYSKLPVIFFEDLPYTQRIAEDQIHGHVNKLGEQLGVKLISNKTDLARTSVDKEKAISVYKSQLNDEIRSEIISYMLAIGGERLWGEDGLLNLLVMSEDKNIS